MLICALELLQELLKHCITHKNHSFPLQLLLSRFLQHLEHKTREVMHAYTYL